MGNNPIIRSNKDVVVNVYQQLKNSMLTNPPRLEGNAVDYLFAPHKISTESAEYAAAKNAVDGYNSSVDLVIKEITNSCEDFKLTTAQIEAGKVIAAIAANPKAAFDRMLNQPMSVPTSENVTVVTHESMGVDSVIPNDIIQASISQEAFDGQQLQNLIYYSIAFNIGASTQDEFAEAIYPTITVSPTESGISVSVEFAAIMKEFLRNTNGVLNPEVMNRIPAIKGMYDNSIFGVDSTAVIPVLRDSNKDKFIEDASYIDDTTPVAIKTAPLKFGESIDLLGISQTDEQLAKGVQDNTDALDRTINLKKIYFTLTNPADQSKELFVQDLSALSIPSATFYAPPNAHYKTLVCNFKSSGLGLNTSNTKTASGVESQVLKGLASGYNIAVEMVVSGDVSTEFAVCNMHAGSAKLVSVRNAAGQLLDTTDAEYVKIKAVIDSIELVGYVLDARRTNTNVRTRGTVISNEMYSFMYQVPYRSGITVIKSLVNYSGTENDANRVASQAQITGFIISNVAVATLNRHVEGLRLASENGSLETLEFGHIGQKFTDPYFREESIDLADVVDSLESNKRDDDIRANILQRINNIAVDMIIKSKYGPSFQVIKGNTGQKITMIIATDPNLARLIVRDGVSEFPYGNKFIFKVVSTYNKLMTGRILILPTVLDANKNSTPDPLNYGFCAYTPTIVYEVTKTTNNAVAGELNSIPRFLHVNNLPIAAAINVSDVTGVFEKIALNVHSVTK